MLESLDPENGPTFQIIQGRSEPLFGVSRRLHEDSSRTLRHRATRRCNARGRVCYPSAGASPTACPPLPGRAPNPREAPLARAVVTIDCAPPTAVPRQSHRASRRPTPSRTTAERRVGASPGAIVGDSLASSETVGPRALNPGCLSSTRRRLTPAPLPRPVLVRRSLRRRTSILRVSEARATK